MNVKESDGTFSRNIVTFLGEYRIGEYVQEMGKETITWTSIILTKSAGDKWYERDYLERIPIN